MRISDWSSDVFSSDLLDWSLLKQAMDTTAKLSSFVVFILIGSTCFGLIFRAVNGDLWVEHLLTSVPGGETGFLIVVNILVFVLAFFLDFFELALVVVPLLAPEIGSAPCRERVCQYV